MIQGCLSFTLKGKNKAPGDGNSMCKGPGLRGSRGYFCIRRKGTLARVEEKLGMQLKLGPRRFVGSVLTSFRNVFSVPNGRVRGGEF